MKNRKSINHFFALVFLICLFSTGFRIHASETPAVRDASIPHTSESIAINETFKLNTLLYSPKESAQYTFTADDPTVVSISTDNVATGLKVGETTLSLEETYQGKTELVDTITFIVKDSGFDFWASKELQLAVNDQETLQIEYENIKASYKMTSSNPSIVYLDSNKNITAKKAGTAYITLTETYQNKSRVVDKLKVTVLNPIFRKSKKTIAVNEQLKPIEQELLYENKKASYKMYTSNKTIVSLASNKVAIGKKAGTATITLKETYQNKTRTVASFKVIVSKAVIKPNDASMIIYMDQKRHFSADFYVSYDNELATYTAKVKDPSICKIEGDNILALKEGSTSLLITETYLNKSSNIGEIEVTVNTLPESIQLDYMSDNPSAGPYFTVLKGVNGNLNTLLDVTPKQLSLQFISSNEDVFSIDKDTSIFQGKTAGEAVITISGKTASLNLAVTVITKNELPQLSEESEKQVAAIDSLDADKITQDNLIDYYNALMDVYKIIGKEMDESDLYFLKGKEQFWMTPNIYKMENYRVTLDKQLLLYTQNMNKKRKISKVNLLNTKTMEIELNIPFTNEEFAYNHLNDFDYYALDAIQQFEIYDSKGIALVDNGSTNYSSGDKNIKINLKKALPDGSYIIKIPSFVLDTDFNFITLDFNFIKKGNSIK